MQKSTFGPSPSGRIARELLTELLSRAVRFLQEPRVEDQFRRESEQGASGDVQEVVTRLKQISQVSWIKDITETEQNREQSADQ